VSICVPTDWSLSWQQWKVQLVTINIVVHLQSVVLIHLHCEYELTLLVACFYRSWLCVPSFYSVCTQLCIMQHSIYLVVRFSTVLTKFTGACRWSRSNQIECAITILQGLKIILILFNTVHILNFYALYAHITSKESIGVQILGHAISIPGPS